MMYYIDMESTIAFWINPVILVGIGTMLWRSQVRRFDQIDKRFDQIDKRFDRIDKRFERIDKRFERIDKRFERIDRQFEQINARFRDIRKQLRDLTREVAANGKSIARIEGRHEGHHRDMATVE